MCLSHPFCISFDYCIVAACFFILFFFAYKMEKYKLEDNTGKMSEKSDPRPALFSCRNHFTLFYWFLLWSCVCELEYVCACQCMRCALKSKGKRVSLSCLWSFWSVLLRILLFKAVLNCLLLSLDCFSCSIAMCFNWNWCRRDLEHLIKVSFIFVAKIDKKLKARALMYWN